MPEMWRKGLTCSYYEYPDSTSKTSDFLPWMFYLKKNKIVNKFQRAIFVFDVNLTFSKTIYNSFKINGRLKIDFF